MTPLMLAVCLSGQYPSPQGQVQSLPASLVYSVPAPTYAAPQVVTLGAGQVMQAGPFGQLLGHVGRKLEKHAWPRVQPIAAAPAPVVQTVFVAVQQPQITQAVYAMPQQAVSPGAPVIALPQLPYGVPQTPAKVPPPQQPYGTPQQPQYQPQAPQPSAPVPRPSASEAVPPVPNR